jgi:long-chain acyl-CoA synthetase
MPHHGPPLAPLVDLTRLLEAGLGGDPAAAALQDLDHSLSWAELDRQVEQLARAYQRLGLRRGDRLASLIPNRVELVVHYLAGLRSGLVLTPLNYRYVPPEIDHALRVSGAAALVFHGERLADVQASAVAGQLPLGCHRIDDPSGFEPLLAAAPTGREAPPWPDLAANEPCFLFFTSGSTGRPKGVTHSRASFAAVLTSFIQASELRAGEEVLAGSCRLQHVTPCGKGQCTAQRGAEE